MAPGSNPPKRKSPRGKKRPRSIIPFDEFVEEAERLRATALAMLRADGYHAPLVVAWTQDGHKELIGLGLPEGFPLSMGQVLTALVRDRRIHCFITIHEAWMTRGQAASVTVPPSQSPEREQVLVVSAIHPERKQMWCYPFAAEGGTVVVGKPISSTGMTLGGGIPEALGKEDKR